MARIRDRLQDVYGVPVQPPHEDPLAELALTVDGQRSSYMALHDLAHELCEGRWLALGGGGYGLVRCVPRAWTHLLAEAVGRRAARAGARRRGPP